MKVSNVTYIFQAYLPNCMRIAVGIKKLQRMTKA